MASRTSRCNAIELPEKGTYWVSFVLFFLICDKQHVISFVKGMKHPFSELFFFIIQLYFNNL